MRRNPSCRSCGHTLRGFLRGCYMVNKKTYLDKLKDPRWQKKRLEILERDEWFCQICGNNESTLHVHHRVYIKDKEPWDYPDEYLVTLCEDCHEIEREQIKKVIDNFVEATKLTFFSADIICLATGLYYNKIPYPSEVTASIIEWCLKDKNQAQVMADSYFAHLGKKQQKSDKD